MSTSSDEVKIQKIEKSGGLLAGLKDKAKEWKDAADEEDNSTEEIESESDAKKTMFRTISNFTLSITHEYDSEDLKDYYLKMNVSQDDIFELKTEIGKTLALIKKYTKNEEISKIQDNIDDISTTDIDIVLQDNLRISLPIVETLDEHLFYKPNSKVVKDITQYAKMLSTLFNDKKGTVENEIKAFINEFIDADVKDNAYIEILQTKKFLSEKMEAAKQEWKKRIVILECQSNILIQLKIIFFTSIEKPKMVKINDRRFQGHSLSKASVKAMKMMLTKMLML